MICFFINDVKLSTVKYILDSSDKSFETTKQDFKSVDYIKYEIFKGYEDIIDDDKKLIAFKYDFQKWVDEIKNVYPEDNFNFNEFYEYLKSHGLVIYPGKTTDIPSFRIGNIGKLYLKDIENLLDKVKMYINKI